MRIKEQETRLNLHEHNDDDDDDDDDDEVFRAQTAREILDRMMASLMYFSLFIICY